MERVLHNDVRSPYLTLVTGPPGSMKSSFCMTLLTNHLSRTGEFGLYCTVEETVESLMRSVTSLGLQLPGSLQITDFTELRRENENMDYLKFTRRMIEHFKHQHGSRFTSFALDSLGAIYSLTTMDEAMRKKMFGFFDFLRSMDLNVFIITERNIGTHAELSGNEGFWLTRSSTWGWTAEMVNSFGRSKSRRCDMFVTTWTSKPSRWGRTVSCCSVRCSIDRTFHSKTIAPSVIQRESGCRSQATPLVESDGALIPIVDLEGQGLEPFRGKVQEPIPYPRPMPLSLCGWGEGEGHDLEDTCGNLAGPKDAVKSIILIPQIEIERMVINGVDSQGFRIEALASHCEQHPTDPFHLMVAIPFRGRSWYPPKREVGLHRRSRS